MRGVAGEQEQGYRRSEGAESKKRGDRGRIVHVRLLEKRGWSNESEVKRPKGP